MYILELILYLTVIFFAVPAEPEVLINPTLLNYGPE